MKNPVSKFCISLPLLLFFILVSGNDLGAYDFGSYSLGRSRIEKTTPVSTPNGQIVKADANSSRKALLRNNNNARTVQREGENTSRYYSRKLFNSMIQLCGLSPLAENSFTSFSIDDQFIFYYPDILGTSLAARASPAY